MGQRDVRLGDDCGGILGACPLTKPRLLFIGDFACATGFGTVNETLLSRLDQTFWNLHILAINATGDPTPLQQQFKIYPAGLGNTDRFGVERTIALAATLQPDLVVIHQDAWNLPGYLEALKILPAAKQPPVIAWCPVDAENQWAGRYLSPDVSLLLCPTQFGVNELVKGGYTGKTAVLPYGIDTTLFTPGDRRKARKAIGFKDAWLDDFIVGRADRNAPRKRYDLTLEAWVEWWRQAGKPENARLLIHCAAKDVGWDLAQLAQFYGFGESRLVFTDMGLNPAHLWPRSRLPNVYRSWDVHFSTTLAEGFGLVAAESAACGVAQLLPRSSAYAELFERTAVLFDVLGKQVTPGGPNTIGRVASLESAIRELECLYQYPRLRYGFSENALMMARDPKFQWATIAQQFETLCREVLGG